MDVLRRSSSPGMPFKAISIGMRDQSLHFLGAGTGVLRDHFDQRRRRVGIGFDVEVVRGVKPGDHQHQRAEEDDQAVVQAPGDDRADHDRRPRGEEECNQPNHLYESNAVIGLHFYRLCQDMRYLQTRVIMIPCVSIIRGTRADKGTRQGSGRVSRSKSARARGSAYRAREAALFTINT